MRDMIELAIEQEAERLDAVLEFPEILDQPLFPSHNSRGRLNPQTRKFSGRDSSRRRFAARTETPPHYVH